MTTRTPRASTASGASTRTGSSTDMGFSQAQYESAVNKVVDGGNKLNLKIGEVAPAANSAMDHWYIPGFIKDAIRWLAEKITQLAQWILEKIIDLLKGAIAPIRMLMDS